MAKNSESIKLNIDVTDALKGLKAVQREAKKTARALREVEGMKNFSPVINITVNSNDGDPEKIKEAIKDRVEKLSTEWQ